MAHGSWPPADPRHHMGPLFLLQTARWELPLPHCSGESSAWSELPDEDIAIPQSHRLQGACWGLPEKWSQGFGCSHPSRLCLGLDGSVLAPLAQQDPEARPALDGATSARELLQDTCAESNSGCEILPAPGLL